MPSEINQSQRTDTLLFHFNEVLRVDRHVEIGSRMVAARAWRGGRGGELVFNG